ncbi:MAG: hypothetical protein J7K69_00385 [Thermotogae bacterium]|nr:hypothetical protein [Thermotogota bacterium]
MRKYLTFILAIIIFAIIHEGTHALIAMAFEEYQAFQVHPYGLEVIFKTPVAEREGIKWGFISGMSNVVTLLLGYLMFLFRVKIARLRSSFLNALGYWLIMLFLLLDALNLSIGPFIYGGDIGGIVVGFDINQYLVQMVFFVILLLNRELIAQKLLPVYGIKTKHPLFRPWIRLKENM